VGEYLRGTAILSALRAGIAAVILWLFGVPVIVPLALVVLVGGFVPYLGGVVSIAAIGLVALGAVGVQSTLLLLVLLVAATVVIARIVRPRVFGDSVHVHPAIVLIALTAGAVIAGIGGVIIAVPAAAVIVAMGGALRDALEPEGALDRDRLVAGWLDRLAQWSWRLLVAFGVAAIAAFLIAQAPLVVAPVVLAIVIASAIAPLTRMLRERGWGPGAAALGATGGTFLVIVAAIAIAAIQMAQPVVEALEAAIQGAGELTDDAGGAAAWIEPLTRVIAGVVRDAAAAVLALFGAVGIVLLVTALLCFYLLRDTGSAWKAALARMRPWRRTELDAAGRRSVDILGGYMFGTAAISAVGAASQLVIMLLLDLPFAIPIAVLSFIACFIPYYGGFITTGLALLVAIAFGTATQVAIMFVYTIVFNIIQGNVVTPIVYNRAVNLHPAVVLLAIPAGGALAGIAGMFLAVPVLAVIATAWRSVLFVLGEKPGPAPVVASAEDVETVLSPVVESPAQVPAD
jgi:predicted PurR-regulated permease PerM